MPIAVVLYALAEARYGLWALLLGLTLTVLAWGAGAVVAGLLKGRWQPALAVGSS